jgi:hypothetical protein
MELVEASDLGIYNPSRLGHDASGRWVILYHEDDLKSWPLPPRYWEVEVFMDRDKAWSHMRELIRGSFTKESLGLFYREKQFGEGEYE